MGACTTKPVVDVDSERQPIKKPKPTVLSSEPTEEVKSTAITATTLPPSVNGENSRDKPENCVHDVSTPKQKPGQAGGTQKVGESNHQRSWSMQKHDGNRNPTTPAHANSSRSGLNLRESSNVVSLTSFGLPAKSGGIAMVILDPQVDFQEDGAMPLLGFRDSCEKIADLIERHASKIHQIIVSMHVRQYNHIAHPNFWVDGEGNHPSPFTIIRLEDVEQGNWRPNVPETDDKHHDPEQAREYCLHYLRQLEEDGRMVLCIWPPHCIVGTPGAQIVPAINNALSKWAELHQSAPHFVFKGCNILSDQHSFLRAEVPTGNEQGVGSSKDVPGLLRIADQVLLCGGSMSHAMNLSLRDLLNEWGEDSQQRGRIAFINDLCPPVPGFEQAADELVRDAQQAGIVVMNLEEVNGTLDDGQSEPSKTEES